MSGLRSAAAEAWAVGAELPTTHLPALTRTELALFAGGSGDHNPVHLDVAAARASGAEDVFVQGMLVMAHLGGYLTQTFPQSQLVDFATRFCAITPVGRPLTCRGRVTAADTDTDTLALALEVVLDDGTLLLDATATIAPQPPLPETDPT